MTLTRKDFSPVNICACSLAVMTLDPNSKGHEFESRQTHVLVTGKDQECRACIINKTIVTGIAIVHVMSKVELAKQDS